MTYTICGYKNNPAIVNFSDQSDKPNFTLGSKTKKSCVGAVGIMLDQFNCKYIEVFYTEDAK